MHAWLIAVAVSLGQVTITPTEPKVWFTTTLTWDGPSGSELDTSPNPFLDYRMTVTFTQGTQTYQVPGFFAADGDAANSLQIVGTGNKWRARFTPPSPGTWDYSVEFVAGANAAIDPSVTTPCCFDGDVGSFQVGFETNPGRLGGFRSEGRLEYVGEHFLQFAQTGRYYLKGGVGSPENFLAFEDFDNTLGSHDYLAHVLDWSAGDPTWTQLEKGKSIIGALNYLAGQGMNTLYFMTFTTDGDSDDVFPWVNDGSLLDPMSSPEDRLHFDCSKLDQWEIVFEHMDDLGIHMHLVLADDDILGGEDLDDGPIQFPPMQTAFSHTTNKERMLYYRELVARFAHHLAVTWNLGEENTYTDVARQACYDHITALDAYDHPVVLHTLPNEHCDYVGMLNLLEGAALQVACASCGCACNCTPEYVETDVHATTLHWRQESIDAGRKWVIDLDEAALGVLTDLDTPDNHAFDRAYTLWANLMAGGGGYSAYFFQDNTDVEDFALRANMLAQIRHATTFFRTYLPFASMKPKDQWLTLTHAPIGWCLAKTGDKYAVYFPEGGTIAGTASLDLAGWMGLFEVRWYDPRDGGSLMTGSIAAITGPGSHPLGAPPESAGEDWAVLVYRRSPFEYDWDPAYGVHP